MADEVKREEFFATPIWSRQFSDPTLNADLERAIYALRDEDPIGVAKSNNMGWQSRDELQNRPEFKSILDAILESSETIREDLNIPVENRFRIATSWCGVNPPGAFNMTHTHPNTTISGVYYVRAPKHGGNIQFLDVRSAHLMTRQGFADPDKPLTWEAITMTPETGRLYMFPAWLPHQVKPNMSPQDRLIISFNLIPSNLWSDV
jgi:uncharacterized protein (TIGR02466 family)